ncbi:MAG TPA: hypothetical protein VG276_27805 [Actinomycetes bacterium]|jgi:hypothetical protein|nr:hypothetical protein [Actinomycetes bacterium]
MTQAHPPGVDVTTRLTYGDVRCQCVRWHRPVPAEEESHHIIPVGAPFHGPANGDQVLLCPTSHSAVHACLRVHLKARTQDRKPTKAELRPYTRYVRKLAQVAMDALGPQADIPLDP